MVSHLKTQVHIKGKAVLSIKNNLNITCLPNIKNKNLNFYQKKSLNKIITDLFNLSIKRLSTHHNSIIIVKVEVIF